MAEASKTEKKSVNRSTAYPGIPLDKAVEATKQLRDNLGNGPYSRESAATALGYKGVSGASTQKISACVHFGLLTRSGNTYSQSDLADGIYRSLDDEERDESIRIAAQRPALYQKLVGEFSGKALPKMLDNILVRNHGITERVAKEAATIFTQTMEYAGLLQNGVLTTASPTLREETDTPDGRDKDPGEDALKRSPAPQLPASSEYVTIVIPETDVRIMFPVSYAYELSIGSFKTGIEALKSSILDVKPTDSSDVVEPPTAA